MSAIIIHEYLPFSEKGGRAEKTVLDYLRSYSGSIKRDKKRGCCKIQ